MLLLMRLYSLTSGSIQSGPWLGKDDHRGLLARVRLPLLRILGKVHNLLTKNELNKAADNNQISEDLSGLTLLL